MKIVCISDQHGLLPLDIPECDIFICAGDICPVRNHTRSFQENWLREQYAPWLKNLPAKHKVIIAGNHDWIFYDSPKLVPKLDCIYLENSGVEIKGIHLYGVPYSLFFNSWAFNFPENDVNDIRGKTWDVIPNNTNILITHGPPLGYGDKVRDYSLSSACLPKSGGDDKLLEAVKRVKPKYHIFGHFHDGCQGEDTISKLVHPDGKITYFCNVSILSDNYKTRKQPTILKY